MKAIVAPPVFAKVIPFIILCSSFMVITSQAIENHDNDAMIVRSIEELKAKISGVMKEASLPGAGIAIVTNDSVVFLGGLGYANIDSNIPATEDTYFRMGSVTKSFIALGFLKLVEAGSIDLSTPVKEIVPEINIVNPWEETDPVRVVHILEHTSGFGNSFREFNVHDDPEMG